MDIAPNHSLLGKFARAAGWMIATHAVGALLVMWGFAALLTAAFEGGDASGGMAAVLLGLATVIAGPLGMAFWRRSVIWAAVAGLYVCALAALLIGS